MRDAYETLDHLRTLRYVDGSRVGVMGGSHGGSTTLATLSTSSIVVAQRLRPGFIAAVALYPGCAIGNPRFNGNAPGGRGATTGGNAEACADSIREVRAFFERELRSR